MSKVKLTPPLCPACEASMDELSVSGGSAWVCSQRPECRGRRSARKQHKPVAATTPSAGAIEKPKPLISSADSTERPLPDGRRGRARTICPATA